MNPPFEATPFQYSHDVAFSMIFMVFIPRELCRAFSIPETTEQNWFPTPFILPSFMGCRLTFIPIGIDFVNTTTKTTLKFSTRKGNQRMLKC